LQSYVQAEKLSLKRQFMELVEKCMFAVGAVSKASRAVPATSGAVPVTDGDVLVAGRAFP
jgi:hypothetical protein